MAREMLYSDCLVDIYYDHLIVKNYYFLWLGRKNLPFDEISQIKAVTLKIYDGKWRLQGTGDFRTWWPYDGNRAWRRKGFIIKRKGKWAQTGLTVENFDQVLTILKERLGGVVRIEK